MAGFLKLMLCLHYNQIPRNLHFVTPNPKIDFKKLKKGGAGNGIAEPEKFAIGLKAVIKYGSNEYTGARPPPKALICKDLIFTHARVAPQPSSRLEPMPVTAPHDCRDHLRRIGVRRQH